VHDRRDGSRLDSLTASHELICNRALRATSGAHITPNGGHHMAVARVTEIISASPKSFDDAVDKGIKRANETLKNLQGAWVKSQKVVIEKGKIKEYRVNLKVTFVLIE
jgi:flavin-binding protein dodecin